MTQEHRQVLDRSAPRKARRFARVFCLCAAAPIWLACIFVVSGLPGSDAYAHPKAHSASPYFVANLAETPGRPAGSTSLFVPEKGKLKILVGGQEAGKEEFEIGPSGGNWIAHGDADVQTPQGPIHVTGTLELRPDGTPVKYEWSTQGAKKAAASISFSGPTATIDLRVEGAKPYTQQFTFSSPQVVILDNNLYHQYAVLARLYDWNRKGPQTFSVLVPQELTPGSVTVESLGKQDVDGKKLDELSVKTEDLELDLFLDGQRLVRITAPAANAEIIRE